jgi:hypothetical protein
MFINFNNVNACNKIIQNNIINLKILIYKLQYIITISINLLF